MTDCLFCKIVAGEIPAQTVYADDDVVAFLDINPLAKGHTLVIPTTHASRLGELDEAAAGAYFAKVPAITQAVEDAVGADGATLAWNDGPAAGQEVDHTHLHIVPRWTGDAHGPIHALFGGIEELSDEVQAKVQEAIRDRLG